MAERGKEERTEQLTKLDGIIKKHEELIPTGEYTNFFFYYTTDEILMRKVYFCVQFP